jgi:hypothetical protein
LIRSGPPNCLAARRLLHPQMVSDRFDKLVARSELPRIGLHDVRHTHATLALQAPLEPGRTHVQVGGELRLDQPACRRTPLTLADSATTKASLSSRSRYDHPPSPRLHPGVSRRGEIQGGAYALLGRIRIPMPSVGLTSWTFAGRLTTSESTASRTGPLRLLQRPQHDSRRDPLHHAPTQHAGPEADT